MVQEVRLYYECMEQANHFILPMIQKALEAASTEIRVKLVKLKGNYVYYGRKVAPIFFWKKPDILMTIIQDNQEYPLLFIEFSTAVFTEDHELQRFDGLLTSARNRCLYAKISPTKKQSPYEHGGQVEFDYAKPFSLIFKRYNLPYFHFEWKCNEKGVVEVDTEYLSCPKPIEELEWLLKTILQVIIGEGFSEEWVNKVVATLQERAFFKEWIEKLESTQQVDAQTLDTSRTRWVERDPVLNREALELKLNRFGHAMDPERGMLAYYATLFPSIISKMMFNERNDAWYKGIPKEGEIRDYISQNGLVNAYDFLYCFALGSGLYQSDEFMGMVETYKGNSSSALTLDLTEFVHRNFLTLNKPLKTIFAYSVLFVIEDDNNQRRIVLRWQDCPDIKVFESYSEITQIRERTTLDEDDVTYIAVHNILKKNGFKIIAVSYPGAQGDRRILVEPGTGRRQPREYIDIISFLPSRVTSLQENIGNYSRGGVQENIDNLSLYKEEQAYINGLQDFQRRFAEETMGTAVKIGVGFWANRAFTASHIKELDLKDLDYFVYITSDRKQWNIWKTGSDNIFSIMSGEVSIPESYELALQNNFSSAKLTNFM
jgi:hypothetical protein